MGKIAFVFAGQGAQYSGMGKSLYETSPAAKAVFDNAEKLRPGTRAQCFNGTPEALSITANTQPCLFTHDYACAMALKEGGITPDCAAGFSLGELPAIAFCGMLEFEAAFKLVMKRAEFMQACAEKNPGAMSAILKLDAYQVETLCNGFSNVYPVNYNCPGQTVVSGAADELAAFEAKVVEAGGRAMRLKVSGSFHSPFMNEASCKLFNYMGALAFAKPSIEIYSNVTAKPYGADPAELLALQVKRPVRWQTTVENMVKAGCDTFIEVGAGKTLSGLIKKTAPDCTVLNVDTAESLAATLAECRV